ncbi:MAG: hypothetical protein DCC75_05920 [Proteobacteria bacterium]|nr:MAG: hypothetical protein DCC75_05920 [Pseudomonadota bacterium]
MKTQQQEQNNHTQHRNRGHYNNVNSHQDSAAERFFQRGSLVINALNAAKLAVDQQKEREEGEAVVGHHEFEDRSTVRSNSSGERNRQQDGAAGEARSKQPELRVVHSDGPSQQSRDIGAQTSDLSSVAVPYANSPQIRDRHTEAFETVMIGDESYTVSAGNRPTALKTAIVAPGHYDGQVVLDARCGIVARLAAERIDELRRARAA